MGAGAAASIDEWVLEASRTGGIATVLGGILTILAASRFVAQLRSALNQVWNVDVHVPEGFKSSVTDYLKHRAFAFGMVLASGPLLLVVFASRALLMGFGDVLFLGSAWVGYLVQASQVLFSLVVVAALASAVFRIVPDARVGWGAIWRGAILTSVLFNIGNLLVGLYLGKANVGAAYGAAGSLVVVLLWLYFSAQIFLYGAEFTQVYWTHFEQSQTRKRGEIHPPQ
jgi:membrane protein